MKWNVGVLIGVVCGALVLAGCSKEPVGTKDLPGAGADLSQVVGESALSPHVAECLTEGINFYSEKQRIDEALQQPREAIAVQIPAAELVYWGKGAGQSQSPFGTSYCEKVLRKILDRRTFDVGDDYNEIAAENTRVARVDSEFRKAVDADVNANPFGVLKAVTQMRQAASVVYQPSSTKGDFEKTADYQARIAREKAEFDKANGGKKITPYDIEFVWMGLFGTPYIESNGVNRESDLYNPDTETLSLTIVPHGKHSGVVGGAGTETIRPPFEIPVKIKLTPEQAQKLFGLYSGSSFFDLRPVVAMQIHNGTLTVKEVSFKDEDPDKFNRLGFTLDHIPVNQELSRNFLMATALAPITAAPGPVAAAPGSDSHCTADEDVVFTCKTGKKLLSVCASKDLTANAGFIQYRFGPKGKPEMRLKEPAEHPSAFAAAAAVPFSGGNEVHIRFNGGDHNYVVYEGEGKGWIRAGVVVEKNGRKVANISCNDGVSAASKLGADFFAKAGMPEDTVEFFGE